MDHLQNITEVTVCMFRCGLDMRVSGADPAAVDSLKVDRITLNAQQRELLIESVWINSGGDHRPKDHVATGTRETVEVESPHNCPNNGNTSPALPVSISLQRFESGVLSGFTSQMYALAARAISGRLAAG